MNYEEARQIGPDGPAPGKWNWSNRNDGVSYTVGPCYYPDFDWDAVTLDDLSQRIEPTGRPRCDHDTKEEAERHYWRHELAHIRYQPFDEATAQQRSKCSIRIDDKRCPNWEDFIAWWPGGYRLDFVCSEHMLTPPEERWPFHPNTTIIHS